MCAAQTSIGDDAAAVGEVTLTVALTPMEASALGHWIGRHETRRPVAPKRCGG